MFPMYLLLNFHNLGRANSKLSSLGKLYGIAVYKMRTFPVKDILLKFLGSNAAGHFPRTVPRRDNWGEVYIHIFMFTHRKTIAFKRNPSGRSQIYEYIIPQIQIVQWKNIICTTWQCDFLRYFTHNLWFRNAAWDTIMSHGRSTVGYYSISRSRVMRGHHALKQYGVRELL
jgi:hypothetical protein